MSRRRRKDPYPYVGTPEGDEIIGKCDGRWCGKELRRGDQFVTTLSKHLVCRSCWCKPIGEWFPKEPDPDFNPVPEEAACKCSPQDVHDYGPCSENCQSHLDPIEIKDFGPDNPYF